MIKVGIVGGTGYTGVELLRALATHPEVQVDVITSRAEAGVRVDELYPNLRGHFDLEFTVPETATLIACDVVFFATPHAVAMHMMAELMQQEVATRKRGKVVEKNLVRVAGKFDEGDLAYKQKNWYSEDTFFDAAGVDSFGNYGEARRGAARGEATRPSEARVCSRMERSSLSSPRISNKLTPNST